jgi:hypothetical protein
MFKFDDLHSKDNQIRRTSANIVFSLLKSIFIPRTVGYISAFRFRNTNVEVLMFETESCHMQIGEGSPASLGLTLLCISRSAEIIGASCFHHETIGTSTFEGRSQFVVIPMLHFSIDRHPRFN